MLVGQHPQFGWRFHLVEQAVDLVDRCARIKLTVNDQRRALDLVHAAFHVHLADHLVEFLFAFGLREIGEELLVAR